MPLLGHPGTNGNISEAVRSSLPSLTFSKRDRFSPMLHKVVEAVVVANLDSGEKADQMTELHIVQRQRDGVMASWSMHIATSISVAK
jgi:hypothetical protein